MHARTRARAGATHCRGRGEHGGGCWHSAPQFRSAFPPLRVQGIHFAAHVRRGTRARGGGWRASRLSFALLHADGIRLVAESPRTVSGDEPDRLARSKVGGVPGSSSPSAPCRCSCSRLGGGGGARSSWVWVVGGGSCGGGGRLLPLLSVWWFVGIPRPAIAKTLSVLCHKDT